MRYFVIKLIVISQGRLSGCSDHNLNSKLSLQCLADSIHHVLAAERRAYEQLVFEHLQPIHQEQLPCPAQLLIQAAHIAQQQGARFSYVLLAQHPINIKNKPITNSEQQALAFIETHKGEHYYGEEPIGTANFFIAAYPEMAYAPHCVNCHNHYLANGQKKYQLNDILGAILIRIPTDDDDTTLRCC